MRFKQASKLHKGDEVKDRRSGEILDVMDTRIIYSPSDPPYVVLYVVSRVKGWLELTHKDVK